MQLARPGKGDEGAVLVDTLSDRLSLDPLYELFRNRHVVKVFHAARQDLEIFQTTAGVLPEPFFDTQVAAMVCGYGDQVGYETLVRQIARAQVDKSSRFTDWSRRPLSAAQMAYALADVTHLRRIYEVLSKRLEETGRAAWVAGGAGGADRPGDLPPRPGGGLDPDQDPLDLAALRRGAARAGAAARDAGAGAQRAAGAHPEGRRAARAGRQPAADRRRTWASRGCCCARRGAARSPTASSRRSPTAEAVPAAEVPQPAEAAARKPGSEALADLLRVLLKARAEAEGVAQRLIASSADLDAIAAGEADGCRRCTAGGTRSSAATRCG